MKSIKQFSFISLAIMFVLTSCTMEKRVYRSGYHIEWLNGKHNRNKNELASKDNIKKSIENKTEIGYQTEQPNINSNTTIETETVSTDNSIIFVTPKPISLPQKEIYTTTKLNPRHISSNEDCDILTLKNGEELKVKVLEIGQSEIKYKKCDNQNGPTISIRKSKVFSIKYPNGSKDIITTNSSSIIPTSTSGDRSLIVAVLLWFFLGLIGIHRFYLGHISMGVLYLLTGGLCGIGWLIDGILFLTGGLKPKNGNYTDNF